MRNRYHVEQGNSQREYNEAHFNVLHVYIKISSFVNAV